MRYKKKWHLYPSNPARLPSFLDPVPRNLFNINVRSNNNRVRIIDVRLNIDNDDIIVIFDI